MIYLIWKFFREVLFLAKAQRAFKATMLVTAVIGLIGIGAGFIGYLNGPLPLPLRLLSFAGGLCMVIPGTLTDVIGAAAVVGVVVIAHFMNKKKAAA